MRRPSTPFLVLGGIMMILFVVGLILIAVLISQNNNPSDLELTTTAIIATNFVGEGSPPDALTRAAATPTAAP